MLAPWIILAFPVLLAFAWASRFILSGPREDVETGLWWIAIRIYARLVHRIRVEDAGDIHRRRHPGALIVVANHTAGVDPLLIQAACSFEIRWIMAQDMRIEALEWFWQLARIIFIDRRNRDMTGTREAIRHVKAGGVLGIFPEGGLERPARTILPFQAGVGLIIRRTGARVLPIVIMGTPIADHAWESLLKRSRSVVMLKPVLDYSGPDWTTEAIADDLRRRYAAWTGWPLNDRIPWETGA